MANITKPRDAHKWFGDKFNDGVKANEIIFKGAMLLLDSNGYLVNAAVGVSGTSRGVAQESKDATGLSSGDIKCEVHSGCFEFDVSGSMTNGDVNKMVFAVDNHTVSLDSLGLTRPAVGRLKWISNLSKAICEVGSADDAGDFPMDRSDVLYIHLGQASSKASDAAVLRAPAPSAGMLLKIKTVINGALATADATVQAKVNGTNAGSTPTGLVTITQSGSAAGDVDSASPITTNVALAENDVISGTVGGGSTATATLEMYALIQV